MHRAALASPEASSVFGPQEWYGTSFYRPWGPENYAPCRSGAGPEENPTVILYMGDFLVE
eukprot:2081983-Pyramimonas_sp.AAC.1